VKDRVQNMSLLILLFCEKNLPVEMGYEQIITIMKKKFFEPSWDHYKAIKSLRRSIMPIT